MLDASVAIALPDDGMDESFVSLSVLRHEFVEPAWIEDRLRYWIERLPRKYQHIIRLRYGLAGNGIHTLQEIAQSIHLSRERVRQLEQRSLFLLRRYSSQPLEDYTPSGRFSFAARPPDSGPPIAPVGLRSKLRSDSMVRQFAKLTVRIRDKSFKTKYRDHVRRYRFAEAANEKRLFRRADVWLTFGKNYWVLFNSQTAIERMGTDPSELRRLLRLKFGKPVDYDG